MIISPAQLRFSDPLIERKGWRRRMIRGHYHVLWSRSHEPVPFGSWHFITDREDDSHADITHERKDWAYKSLWKRFETYDHKTLR
jgi:hypothetical protein